MRRVMPLALALGAVLVVGAVVVSHAFSRPTPQTATGLIVSVDASGLADVHGFALRTNDGQTVTFKLGSLENGSQFPPGHLREHMATAEPVRVYYRDENGERVVYRLEDASS